MSEDEVGGRPASAGRPSAALPAGGPRGERGPARRSASDPPSGSAAPRADGLSPARPWSDSAGGKPGSAVPRPGPSYVARPSSPPPAAVVPPSLSAAPARPAGGQVPATSGVPAPVPGGLLPARPWNGTPPPSAPAPQDDAADPPAPQDDAAGPLAPVRPWNRSADAARRNGGGGGRREPAPLTARRETDEQRRQRFARQHAAADAELARTRDERPADEAAEASARAARRLFGRRHDAELVDRPVPEDVTGTPIVPPGPDESTVWRRPDELVRASGPRHAEEPQAAESSPPSPAEPERPLDIDDAPAPDLRLAETSAAAQPGQHRAGRLSRLIHRRELDEDESPFFPPETADATPPVRDLPDVPAPPATTTVSQSTVPAAGPAAPTPTAPTIAGATETSEVAIAPQPDAAPQSESGDQASAPPERSSVPPSRPRPRPRSGDRPSAAPPAGGTVAGATAPTAATTGRPRPRPRPPTTGAAASSSSSSSSASSAAGEDPEPAPTGTSSRVDISRLVEATAPKSATSTAAGTEAAPKPRRGFREYLRGSRRTRLLVKLAILVVVTVVTAGVLRAYVVSPFYIPSESMEPTLQGCNGCGKTDDRVLVDKFSYHFHAPHVGDIVVFDRPKNFAATDSQLIKRVVAIPGDQVVLRNGLVYVNGSRLTENYLNKACGPRPSAPETGRSRWTVPDNDLFVMGDNRCNSTDSRTFGPIPISSVIGRAFAIIWPLSRLRTL